MTSAVRCDRMGGAGRIGRTVASAAHAVRCASHPPLCCGGAKGEKASAHLLLREKRELPEGVARALRSQLHAPGFDLRHGVGLGDAYA